MPNEILFYSAPLCGDCQHLKQFMDAREIPYTVRDIKANPEYARELEERTGKQGVPFLVIDGEWKRGYDPGKPFTEEFAATLFD
jgi:glutaredoxin-like protein NrdH